MEKEGARRIENFFFKRIKEFVCLDTSDKNESKKVIVVVRIMIISLITYFTVYMAVCNLIFENVKILMFYSSFLLLFVVIFGVSYYYKTYFTLWAFNIGTIIWIIAIVHCFGWNIGVQHFLMVLLILYFFSDYKKYVGKVAFAVCICALRIALFFPYKNDAPIWQLEDVVENSLQVLNTITIFWCISVISFIFGKDTQEMEGKLIEYNSQLQKQANTDSLTGLYNRRKAMDYMNFMITNSGGERGFCLCICDIDFFKKVNDNYGHDFGDVVLKTISDILQSEMQGKGIVARWGGEEFLLVFSDCNGDEAYIEVEEIRRKIKEAVIKNAEQSIQVTMTFGVAEYDMFNGLDVTLKEADEKLYIGKEKGRDIIIF